MNTSVNCSDMTTSMSMSTSTCMLEDDLSEPSSPESGFDASELLQGTVADEVTAQLAAAGTIYLTI